MRAAAVARRPRQAASAASGRTRSQSAVRAVAVAAANAATEPPLMMLDRSSPSSLSGLLLRASGPLPPYSSPSLCTTTRPAPCAGSQTASLSAPPAAIGDCRAIGNASSTGYSTRLLYAVTHCSVRSASGHRLFSTAASPSADPPVLKALTESYIRHVDIKTNFSNPTTYPYPIVDATRRHLRHQTMLQLSTLGDRSLSLACPHPGASTYLEDTVKAVAQETRSDLVVLDYLTILRASNEAFAWKRFSSGEDRESLRPARRGSSFQAIKATPPFSPSDYKPHFDEMEEDDEEFDEDEEGEEEEDYPRNSRNGSFVLPGNFQVKVFVPGANGRHHLADLPAFKDNGKLFVELGGSAGSDDSMATHFEGDQTHYHTQIASSDLDMVFKSLLQQLKSPTKASSKRVIVYLKDTTEILEASKETGKRVLGGLIDLIKVARHVHNQSVTLIAGCTPSILQNLCKDSVSASAEFYHHLYSAHVNSVGSPDGTPFLLADTHALFKTCIDGIPEFDKIEVPPPSPSLLNGMDSLSNTDESDGLPAKNNWTVLESHYRNWLRMMELGHQHRYRELNWRNFTAACADRGITLRGLELADITPPEGGAYDATRVPPALQGSLSLLNSDLWPKPKIEKMLNLAVGHRLNAMMSAVSPESELPRPVQRHSASASATLSPIDLTSLHLTEALSLMRAIDYGRSLQLDEDVHVGVGAAKKKEEEEVRANDEDVGSKKDGGRGGDRGDGSGGAVVTGTVNAEPTPVTNASTEFPQADPVAPPETAESRVANLKKLLAREGHKLNTYETKLLGTVITPANIAVSFNELILPAPTKLMLQTLVTLPLLQPQHFSTGILSRHSISGVLLFGPPGTGKTMLAKAVAKSSGARFMAVALSDVFDKYVGEGEKNTRAIFTLARKLAPCVVFLDEVDALFGARRGGDGMHSSKREIINEFMSEWDGLASANRGVIVMGATNRPFDLDDAILRRMPRRVLVDLPDAAAREKILASHLRDEALAPDVSLQSLAERTVLYSGSDLKNVCISAALNSVKETVARELFEPKSTATASAPVTSFSTESTPSSSESTDPSIPPPSSSSPESLINTEQPMSTSEILNRIEAIDSWADVLPSVASASSAVPSRVLNAAHFEGALKEVPPSLTEETQTLVELRKWDDLYGEGAAKRKGAARKGWGFGIAAEAV